MSLNILRWKGGYAGDLILNLILKSYPTFQTNTIFTEITIDGGVGTDTTHLNNISPREIDLIGSSYNPHLDEYKLKKELQNISEDENVWWIKSHYYKLAAFNKFTIDIIADELSLPFVVYACMKKCTPQGIRSDILNLISDDIIAEKYTIYNILKNSWQSNDIISDRCILVSSIIFNFDTLKESLAVYNIILNESTREFYQSWQSANTKYIPGEKYFDYIKNKKYNFDDSTLSLYERYSLLILANKNFKILT